MEYIGLPAIIIICYLVGEIFKLLIFKKKRRYKYIPIVVGLFGAGLGLLIYYVAPEMIDVNNPFHATAIGIISGLASTGTNELLKQILKEK